MEALCTIYSTRVIGYSVSRQHPERSHDQDHLTMVDSDIPFIDISLTEDNIPDVVKKVVATVRPHWQSQNVRSKVSTILV